MMLSFPTAAADQHAGAGGGGTTIAAWSSVAKLIDEIYEFSAPRFFDFTRSESDEEARKAELWFDNTLSYAPSPLMPRIKTGRSFKIESLCDFTEADQIPEASKSSNSTATASGCYESKSVTEDNKLAEAAIEEIKDGNYKASLHKEDHASSSITSLKVGSCVVKEQTKTEAYCTPQQPSVKPQKGRSVLTDSKKYQSARQVSSLVKNHPPSVLKSKSQAQSSQAKCVKPWSIKKVTNVKNPSGTPTLAHENQAIKRQKLEDGQSRQILNLKPPQPLTHKSRLGLSTSNSNTASKIQKEERKVYAREPAVQNPFISTAEMMKKFETSTRDLSMPLPPVKPKLTLTRPQEPAFETAQRIRPVKIKSTAELEQEMLAKIPKFKARPINKKVTVPHCGDCNPSPSSLFLTLWIHPVYKQILEAPRLPAIPRSTPQPPEFQEFHLETSARANHNAESASVVSEATRQNNEWKPHLTEPKTPLLQTSLRARPMKVKSSFELEIEELEKMPKFKAKPLNKKIFESKGELGIFCNTKKQVTVPKEFHFAIDERIPPPNSVADMLDKERGAEKERRLAMELMRKQMEDELARVPKANPYPYTTDYPVVPPKPTPKPSTRPEPFELESLVRHEEEMQKEMEERQRKEREEAQMRVFKAQPILKEDPIPVPEKVRRPLTEVQQIHLHVDHRAVDRAEFDQKASFPQKLLLIYYVCHWFILQVKEKEMLYKRYREESEAAKMIEEEKAMKQLRRTMVPHARPVPNFEQPFCPKRSTKETTRPKSPRLRVLQRREKQNKTSSSSNFMMAAATSSPASCMR
ncbi:Protein TPX2 [Linum perenne]